MFEKYCSHHSETNDGTATKSKPEPIFDGKRFEVAIDISGSTNRQFPNSSKTIIQGSIDLVRKVFSDPSDIMDEQDTPKYFNQQVFGWSTKCSIFNSLLDVKSDDGGTDPTCLFEQNQMDGVETLFITTDGEIPSESVNRLNNVVASAPKLTNAVCIYVGKRTIGPCRLNLPVFAPFLKNLTGQVLVTLGWSIFAIVDPQL